MGEEHDGTLGYMGEMHLHNGTVLYELKKVKEFDTPGEGAREQVEDTDLKSGEGNWRRSYLSGFYEDSDFEVLLKSRILSDTDTLLASALAAADVRPFKAVIPLNGVPYAQITGTCKCTGYNRGRVTPGQPIDATATFRVVTVDSAAPYAA